MKKNKILTILSLVALTFCFGLGQVHAIEKTGPLSTVTPSSEEKHGHTIRYYEEFADKNAAKNYILTNYEDELQFLASKAGMSSIDIDDETFQSHIMGMWFSETENVSDEKLGDLRALIDIYEKSTKNDKIEILKNKISLTPTIGYTNVLDELEVLMPINLDAVVDDVIVSPRYSNGYNPTVAINYAHQWAYGYNTTTYSKNDQDCANFVSQCLFEGGMNAYYVAHWPLVGNIIQEHSDNWYFYDENGRKAPSYTWGGAAKFYTHWTNKRGATATTNLSNFAVGDPIACDWSGNGDINHIVIVDGKTGNTSTTITYSGHSNPRMNEPIQTLYSSYSGTILYALKVANASN